MSGTVAIEAVVDGHLELDELMILPGITSAAHPCRGGGEIILRAASVEEDAATVPGETGSAFTADGERLGPINRGRRSVPAGAFAITTRRSPGCRRRAPGRCAGQRGTGTLPGK